MTDEECVIASCILKLVLERHKNQISRLQELLGVSEDFEQRVQDLWDRANSI